MRTQRGGGGANTWPMDVSPLSVSLWWPFTPGETQPGSGLLGLLRIPCEHPLPQLASWCYILCSCSASISPAHSLVFHRAVRLCSGRGCSSGHLPLVYRHRPSGGRASGRRQAQWYFEPPDSPSSKEKKQHSESEMGPWLERFFLLRWFGIISSNQAKKHITETYIESSGD